MSAESGARVAVEAQRSAAPRGISLQRKCDCGRKAAGGECGACADERRLQRRAGDAHEPSPRSVPSSVDAVLSGSGRPLVEPTRSLMESRFGRDFGEVRVHDDASAAASARDVHAHAYTVGQDLVFAEGRYRPETSEGQALLAHELAHSIQQRGLQRRADGAIPLDDGPGDQALEREADAMADAALGGRALPPAHRAGAPVVARAKQSKEPPASKTAAGFDVTVDSVMSTKHHLTPDETMTVGAKTSAGFSVDALVLPASKGPKSIFDVWKKRAEGGALVAFINVTENTTKAGLWQEREGTDDLRERWRQRMGWDDAAADQAWKAAGKAAGVPVGEFPRVRKDGALSACQMDHVIELQVGGGNEDSNIQVLDGGDNRKSGSAIKEQVFGIARAAKERLAKAQAPAQEIRLTFKTVKPEKSEDGTCGPCCRVGSHAKSTGKTSDAAADLVPYEIVASKGAGGATATLRVPKAPGPKAMIRDSGVPENKSAASLISGLLLVDLSRDGKKHAVHAELDAGVGRKSRLPIAIAEKSNSVILNVVKGHLSLANSTPHLAFAYPYLSKGEITKLAVESDSSISGAGTIRPTARFLPKLEIRFGRDRFAIVTALDKDKLKSPFPGAKITKAELGIDLLPEFKPYGQLEVAIGAGGKGGKPLADASFEVTRDADGLVLDGVVRAHLPGVDKAESRFRYAKGQWTGSIRVESSKIAVKFVKGGFVEVLIGAKGVAATGQLELELPGGNPATVKLTKGSKGWAFHGTGTFKVPRKGVEPVQLTITCDEEKLVGEGETGFEFKGFKGRVHVHVASGAGGMRVSGVGKLEFAKGKLRGRFDPIRLSPEGEWTGKGEASYQFSEQFVATAGIEIGPREKVRFKGALEVVKPIKLFDARKGKKELFKTPKLTIPVPFLSIGTAGLVIKIYGSLSVHYSLGPGVIQSARVEADFSPFEENVDPDVALQGRLSIPATAGIEAELHGDVALDVLIASVAGGLAIVSSFDLSGEAFVEARIQYVKRRLAAEGKAGVRAALDLKLGLKAQVTAEAGIAGIGVSTTKEWDLARKTFPTGLEFGMAIPVKYEEGTPFQMPSIAQIEWSAPPKIDVAQLLKTMLDGAPSKERKS